jgi:hypothetical protein
VSAVPVPPYVADFDSSTGLVRALAAALHRRPYRRLDRSAALATAVRASRVMPRGLRMAAFREMGGREGIRPNALADLDPDRFAEWVCARYGRRRADVVAIGSSNGAVMHLCAAMGVPWLPQTFLVPVRRNAAPEDCRSDFELAVAESGRLLARQDDLQIHQMHDPNQDRLMVARIAYFRMKLRGLPDAYRRFIRDCLNPGGTLLVVDCTAKWPVSRRGERHVYQHGAVGGLAAGAYDERWDFPAVDGCAPEAEWGYEPALTDAICGVADAEGYRVIRLSFPSPEAPSAVVADLHRDWYAECGAAANRLLAETFICVEPSWVLETRTVPLWLTFGVEPSLATLQTYLSSRGDLEQLLVTLFPHGVRSLGYAAAARWRAAGEDRGLATALAGVAEKQWPADFASLASYADALERAVPRGPFPPPLPLDRVAAAVAAAGPAHDLAWSEL